MTRGIAWPELSYEAWEPGEQTLHRYTQIVGKVRMALVPPRNHWWHVTLYVTEHGLSTGPMPYNDRDVAVDFDLLEHQLIVSSSDGRRASFPLAQRPACADRRRTATTGSVQQQLRHGGVLRLGKPEGPTRGFRRQPACSPPGCMESSSGQERIARRVP